MEVEVEMEMDDSILVQMKIGMVGMVRIILTTYTKDEE